MKEIRSGSGGESEKERYTIPRIEPAARKGRHPLQSKVPQFDEDIIIMAPTTGEHYTAYGIMEAAGLIVRAPRGSEASAAAHFRFKSASRQKDARERS